MEINVIVLKKEIIDKAVTLVNQKLNINLVIKDFKKESKYGEAIISCNDLSPEISAKIGYLLYEKIGLITNHRWGKGIAQ